MFLEEMEKERVGSEKNFKNNHPCLSMGYVVRMIELLSAKTRPYASIWSDSEISLLRKQYGINDVNHAV